MYQKVRGGFSTDASINGLNGDFTDWLNKQTADVQAEYYAYQSANPGSPIGQTISTVPKTLWLLLGGFVVFAFLLPSRRR